MKSIFLNEIDRYLKKEVTMHIDRIEPTWWAHFPDISVELHNANIVQNIGGVNDTLFSFRRLGLGLDISELLQNDFTIEKIFMRGGCINLRKFSSDTDNYSIISNQTLDTSTAGIGFDMEQLLVEDVEFLFEDVKAKDRYSIYFKGNQFGVSFKEDVFKSLIEGEMFVKDVSVRGDQFVKEKSVITSLKLNYNNLTQEVELGKSLIKVNGGSFDLKGRYLHQKEQYVDLKISASRSEVSTITALLPTSMSKYFHQYETKGKVYFEGSLEGELRKGPPNIDIDFGFSDASFFAPRANQKIENAFLKGSFSNGKNRDASSSKLEVEKFDFKLQNGNAKGHFSYSNFTSPYLDLFVEANMKFSDLSTLLDMEKVKNPKGTLEGKVLIKAPVNLLLNDPQNKRVVSKGEMKIKNVGFDVNGADFRCEKINGHFLINKADLGIIDFSGQLGNSDFKIDGIAHHFLPFLLLPEQAINLQGSISSKRVDLDQLLSQNLGSDSTDIDSSNKYYNFKITPLLAFDLNCELDEINFRRLKGDRSLKHVEGDLHLKDQYFEFTELDYHLAQGVFQSNGFVNAKQENNIIAYAECDLTDLDVNEFFYVFENFNQDFISDKELTGVLSGGYDVRLNFDRALRLDLEKLRLNAEMKISYGELNDFAPLMEMGSYLTKKKYQKYVKNTDLANVKFSELQTSVHVKNKEIFIPQTIIKNSVSEFTISGTHTFENEINYIVSLPLINYQKHGDNLERVDKDKFLNITMNIFGDIDDYEVDVVEKEVVRSLKDVIRESFRRGQEPKEAELELDLGEDAELIELE